MNTPAITRRHATRLRQIHRSSGWPCRDMVEVELQVAGLIIAVPDSFGRETLQLTPAGLVALAEAHCSNKASRKVHDGLVERVGAMVLREGRVVWTGVPLRAQVNGEWVQAIPDVFSVRNTTVEAYLEPVVHEIKVSRADLLGDIKKSEKRAAYLAMASQVYYVLGVDGRGRPIGIADDVPPECGVMLVTAEGLELARPAPKQPFNGFRFDIWMALAKAVPMRMNEEPDQLQL